MAKSRSGGKCGENAGISGLGGERRYDFSGQCNDSRQNLSKIPLWIENQILRHFWNLQNVYVEHM